jgi:hypothetical protein
MDKKSARRLALFKRMGFFGANTLGYEITRATTLDDLVAAYSLVHDCFVERGYILPHPSGMRLRCHEAANEMATFVAKLNGQVIGVQSIIADSEDLGLPADGAFRREIDVLRNQGRCVYEATNEAIASLYRRTSLAVELIQPIFAQTLSAGGGELH